MKSKGIKNKYIQKEDSSTSNQKKLNTNRKEWTKEEDKKLTKVIDTYGNNWKQVSVAMGDRNPSQCAQRWKRIKPESERMRRVWTNEEDELLLKLIDEHGQNWAQISKFMNNRTGKQIRERYINQLNPKIKNTEWSKEEDLLILKLYQNLGSKWTEISKQLEGRTENGIKNRFYSHIRQFYMNIENPYYVLQKKELQTTVDQVKIEEQKNEKIKFENNVYLKEPSDQNFGRLDQRLMNKDSKNRSLSYDSINRQKNFDYENSSIRGLLIKQDLLMRTYSSKESKSIGISEENLNLFQSFRHHENQEINQEHVFPQPGSVFYSYSDKKPLQRNASYSLQYSSGGLSGYHNPYAPPFMNQYFKPSLGISEENGSIKMSESLPMDQMQPFYPNPFASFLNTNVLALPVMMRNDFDLIQAQMESIKLSSEAKK